MIESRCNTGGEHLRGDALGERRFELASSQNRQLGADPPLFRLNTAAAGEQLRRE
jgi:hypothetical protein